MEQKGHSLKEIQLETKEAKESTTEVFRLGEEPLIYYAYQSVTVELCKNTARKGTHRSMVLTIYQNKQWHWQMEITMDYNHDNNALESLSKTGMQAHASVHEDNRMEKRAFPGSETPTLKWRKDKTLKTIIQLPIEK